MTDESKLIYNFEFMKKYGVDISGGMPDNATAMEEICRRVYNKGWMDCKATMDGRNTNVGEWIPCSERLPDDFGLYLASYMDYTGYHVNLLVFDPKEHFDVDFWKEEIDAWMPLPTAYKEGE